MLAIVFGFFLTFIAYICAKPINKKFPQIPVIVIGMFFVIALLFIFGIPYEQYMAQVNPFVHHLLDMHRRSLFHLQPCVMTIFHSKQWSVF